jgi:hypothetical protein
MFEIWKVNILTESKVHAMNVRNREGEHIDRNQSTCYECSNMNVRNMEGISINRKQSTVFSQLLKLCGQSNILHEQGPTVEHLNVYNGNVTGSV